MRAEGLVIWIGVTAAVFSARPPFTFRDVKVKRLRTLLNRPNIAGLRPLEGPDPVNAKDKWWKWRKVTTTPHWFDYPDSDAEKINNVYKYIGELPPVKIDYNWVKYVKYSTFIALMITLAIMMNNALWTVRQYI